MRLLPFLYYLHFFFLSDTIFLRCYNDKLCEYSLPEFHRHSISMYVQRACANVVKTFAKPKEVRSLFMWRFLVIKKKQQQQNTHMYSYLEESKRKIKKKCKKNNARKRHIISCLYTSHAHQYTLRCSPCNTRIYHNNAYRSDFNATRSIGTN